MRGAPGGADPVLTHPDTPVRNYGLMKDPAAYEGAGCISFGFYLAGAAGVLLIVALASFDFQ